MKIIVGAGNTKIDGWISTQECELNLLDERSWKARFEENSLSHILAEHVWEHMTFEEGIAAAKICYKYLRNDGMLRVAVPDAYYRNDWYQNMVRIGGPGIVGHPAESHKIVYDYQKLRECFISANYIVDLLEYCDEYGVFHYKYWNLDDGMIGRSFRFDSRNTISKIGMVSIIIDAKKELLI